MLNTFRAVFLSTNYRFRGVMNLDLLKELEGLVREAGNTLLDLWPGSPGAAPLEIHEKPDGTKVTNADLLINEFLVSRVRSLAPSFGLISEEGTIQASEYRKEYCVIMDPLDGTHAFIDGRKDFSILVGITQHAVPVAGLMYFPALQTLATALVGNFAAIDGVAPRLSAAANLGPARVSLRKCPETKDFRVLQEPLDSGFALLELARGNLDAVVIRMLTHREWDLAAPMAVLAQIGAHVTDEHGNRLTFDSPGISFDYFIASNGPCHAEVRALIGDLPN